MIDPAYWDEDELESMIGYMTVVDPAGLAPVTDPDMLGILPWADRPLNLRPGDLLRIMIVASGDTNRASVIPPESR